MNANRRHLRRRIITLMTGLLCALVSDIRAPAQVSVEQVQRNAYIEQRLGQAVPRELAFVDEQGTACRLGDFVGARPALLVLAYFRCPDLCPMTLRHLTEGLNGIAERAGRDFDVVVVSFDPADTPARAAGEHRRYARAYTGGDSEGWHFLTGPRASIDGLREAVGYHSFADPANGRFVHAAGVIVVDSTGRLSHYFFGVDYSPAELAAALRDADAGIATPASRPEQQYCFAYDPAVRGRGRIIMTSLRAAGVVWVAALAGYIGLKLVRERRARAEVTR